MAAVTAGSDVTAGEPTLVIMMTLNERLHFDGVMEGIHALGDSDLHVLCVDDDSLDGTWRNYGTNWAAENAQYHLLRRTGRFKGQGSAMRDGIQWALDNEKDFTNIVVIAGNQTDDPAHIPAMLAKLRAGADIVVAQRSGKSSGALTRMATGAPFTDVESGFRAYRLAALQTLHFDKISVADHRIKTELLARAKQAGCKFDTIDVDFKPRPDGAEMRGGVRGAFSSLGLFLRRVTGLL